MEKLPLTVRDLEKYVRKSGCSVEQSGKPGHGRIVICRPGKWRPFPSHGQKNGLRTGTIRTLVKFINQTGAPA